jgi:hypothetical protein
MPPPAVAYLCTETEEYSANDHFDIMACILARPTLLLLTGADASTHHIVNSVWGDGDDKKGPRPRGDLSLIWCRKIHTISPKY